MNKTYLLITACMVISFFLNILWFGQSPACFNADEAAFGYNAYSLLKTGKDEYGTPLPLRLKSFGDYKMPLYSYLSVPFVGTMGLSEASTRALNSLVSFLFPLVAFLLTQELFKNRKVAVLAALLLALSTGLHSIGRQAHEAYLTAFLITSASLFYIRYIRTKLPSDALLFFSSLFLSLFSYQSSRVFALFFLLWTIFLLARKKVTRIFLILFIGVMILGFMPDLIFKPTRVANLLFFNTAGFPLSINELRGEGGNVITYNKLTVGIKQLAFNYAAYFSPEFLVTKGDENYRFGYPGQFSPITLIEFVGALFGLYFIFARKEHWRYFLLGILLFTPTAAALSWNGTSLTRSLFILIPILILCAYGAVSLLNTFSKRWIVGAAILLCCFELFFLYYNWDFYLFHYSKRARIIHAWQCGYQQLAQYIKTRYNDVDKIYLSKENGEPYIFQLFYMQYDPVMYQKEANLTAPDQYGFGQIDRFGKFDFNFTYNPKENKYLLIGSPGEFKAHPEIQQGRITPISQGTEEMFWVYEPR